MPDVGMAQFQMTRQRRIINACEKWWPLIGPSNLVNKSDCSGFVTSVAKELDVSLVGDANCIYTKIQGAGWSVLGFGDSAAHLAAVAATNGLFVVGAWRNPSGGRGHVAVIVDTNYSSPSVPYRTRALAYWGTLGAEGQKRSLHSESWGVTKRPQVLYAATNISES
jgi:hypothetical protein